MTYHFCLHMNQLTCNSLKSLDSRNAKIFICSTCTRTQPNFEMFLVSEAHIEIIIIIIMVSNCLSLFEIFLFHDFQSSISGLSPFLFRSSFAVSLALLVRVTNTSQSLFIGSLFSFS